MNKGILFAGVAIAFGFLPVSAGAETLPLVAGTVVMVDAKTSKFTIEHEPIANLNVGQMTMVFNTATADLIRKARIGDSVRFTAIRMNGQATVTSIINETALLSGESCE